MTIVTFFGGVTAICVAIWASFMATEHVASEQARRDASKSIADLDPTNWISVWPAAVVGLFHGVFGDRIVSIRFFLRSAVLSSVLLVAVTLAYIAVQPTYSFAIFQEDSLFELKYPLTRWLGFNVFADYLSLVETLLIISLLSRLKSVSIIVLALILDFILTAFIFVIWGDIIKYIQEAIRLGFGTWDYEVRFFFVDLFWSDVKAHFLEYPSADSRMRALDHFTFYTTFFTSVWVWMYVLATLGLVVFERYGGRVWPWLSRFLNFSEKPFSSLGYVACSMFIFISIVVGLVYFSAVGIGKLV